MMREYEIVQGNGESTDFKATGLKSARRIAKFLKNEFKGKIAAVYEGYTCKFKV